MVVLGITSFEHVLLKRRILQTVDGQVRIDILNYVKRIFSFKIFYLFNLICIYLFNLICIYLLYYLFIDLIVFTYLFDYYLFIYLFIIFSYLFDRQEFSSCHLPKPGATPTTTRSCGNCRIQSTKLPLFY